VKQAFRFQLDPNAGQGQALTRHAGMARYAFNWALDLCRACLEAKEPVPDGMTLHRIWNGWKQGNAPWWAKVSKCAPQEAFRDLDRAFANFRRGRRSGRWVGFPRFRKKGRDDRFRLTGATRVLPRAMALPRLGAIRTKEPTAKFSGRILSASVSREVDRWYVSLTVERDRPDAPFFSGPTVGVDVGLDCFAALSDGARVQAPKPLAKNLKRLRRRSRALSRKKKGSANRRKAALALARLHRRVRNQRKDFLHKLTTHLARTKSVIVVEHLTVSGMVRNRRLARRIADAGWSEFRRMLGYKTLWHGSHLVVAPRFFASSRTCSACGAKRRDLALGDRVFACSRCGVKMDRDLNAALNLARLVAGSSPETENACGADVRPAYGGPTAGKQESLNG
jgi:putative transposase